MVEELWRGPIDGTTVAARIKHIHLLVRPAVESGLHRVEVSRHIQHMTLLLILLAFNVLVQFLVVVVSVLVDALDGLESVRVSLQCLR